MWKINYFREIWIHSQIVCNITTNLILYLKRQLWIFILVYFRTLSLVSRMSGLFLKILVYFLRMKKHLPICYFKIWNYIQHKHLIKQQIITWNQKHGATENFNFSLYITKKSAFSFYQCEIEEKYKYYLFNCCW